MTYMDFSRFETCFAAGKVEVLILIFILVPNLAIVSNLLLKNSKLSKKEYLRFDILQN